MKYSHLELSWHGYTYIKLPKEEYLLTKLVGAQGLVIIDHKLLDIITPWPSSQRAMKFIMTKISRSVIINGWLNTLKVNMNMKIG